MPRRPLGRPPREKHVTGFGAFLPWRGLTNGAVLSVTDNLSGVTQNLTYASAGGGTGQVATVNEVNGGSSYSSSYTYNTAGDRETATYTTQAALGQPSTVSYKYDLYRTFGDPTGGSRAFRRLTKIDPSTGIATAEQFRYNYDSAGRIQAASFAMTPKASVTGPLSNGYWYDSANDAQTRGRAYYEYLQTGQLKGIYHWWDTLQSNGSYTSQFIRGNECDYEVTTGLRRGLKTASRYLVPVSGYPLNWQTQRQETYSYDANLDYLVGANYGDGLPNANVTWTYDAAGNRASDSSKPGAWTYDNLNRMTASPGVSYTNDILGNRTSKTENYTSISWDPLNRMVGTFSDYLGIDITLNQYRADGLRVDQLVYNDQANDVSQENKTKYDGQMPMETLELWTQQNQYGSYTTVPQSLSRNTLGARGIDAVTRTNYAGATTVSYPIYDAHGTQVTSLTKNGSGGFSLSTDVSFDAWGGERVTAGSTNRSGYCANLGHTRDRFDGLTDTGLIYMRARYYEPGSGRFVSEDPGRNGANWFTYAGNCPIDKVDQTGKADIWTCLLIGIGCALIAAFTTYSSSNGNQSLTGKSALIALIAGACTAAALDEVQAAATLKGTDLVLANFGIGGGINLLATLLVDWITNDTSNIWGDAALAFLCGGVGGCVGGVGDGETFNYMLGGGLMSILQGAGSSAIKSK